MFKSASFCALLLLAVGCAGGGAQPEDVTEADESAVVMRQPAAASAVPPLHNANLFYSGHSLIDNPVPDDVASIIAGFGHSSGWNQQNVVGSPIRMRTRGEDSGASTFRGYRTGKNREGNDMDVVAELRRPRTIGPNQRYDVLVITERHDGPGVLQWEDSVRYLRHFHDRLIEGNPAATSYLYHAWWSVADKAHPASWVAYERNAARMWQCVAARINVSLAAEARVDRVHYLPAGLALAELVERATAGNVPGVSAGSVTATMDALFSDDVHLRHLGQYFMSLVTYASVFRRAPTGAFVPADITAAQAASLQQVAWDVVSRYYASPVTPTMAECQAHMRDHMCAAFYSTTGTPQHADDCGRAFTAQSNDNPFYYSAATDSAYWYPAP